MSIWDPAAHYSITSQLSNLPSLVNHRRVLTCVNFSERAPVIVVGDNSGAVTVYRVLSPTLITHLGPLQQTEGLKAAVLGSADPTILALLQDNKDAATPSEEVKS